MKRLFNSFRNGFRGIGQTILSEPNFRIHLLATVVAVGLGYYFRLTTTEWLMIALAIGMVLAAEAFNTALEDLADAVHPGKHPLVGKAKDAAAAGVLIAAIAAAVLGGIVFGPKLWMWLNTL